MRHPPVTPGSPVSMHTIRLLAILLLAGCGLRAPLEDPIQVRGADRTVLPLLRAVPDADKVHVQVDIGLGRPALFLVDTGASVSVVTREVVDELKLEPVEQAGLLEGLGGAMRWSAVTLPVVRLGDVVLHDVQAAADIRGMPATMGAVPLDGILGNNVWRHFVVTVDYPADRLELATPGAVEVPPTAAPMLFDGLHCYGFADLQASGQGETVRTQLLLALDTGARGVLLSGNTGNAFSRVATEGEEPIFGIGSGEDLPATGFMHRTRRVDLDSVTLGGVTVEDPGEAQWIGFEGQIPVGPADMPGLIGHTILSGWRAVFDYPGNRFALVPGEAPPEERPDSHELLLDQDIQQHGATNPQRGLFRARLLAWLERFDEAQGALTEYLAVAPDDAEARLLAARIHLFQGDEAGWWDTLAPLTPAVLVEQGEIVPVVDGHILAGRLDRARELALAAVEAQPEASAARVALSDVLLAQGDPAGARAALKEANRLDESPDGHLLRRARIALAEGDRWAAVAHVRRLLEVYPLSGFALWFYGHLATSEDVRRTLAADMERALSRTHAQDRPMDFVAATWAVLGDPARARAWYEQGRTRDCEDLEEPSGKANCEAWYRAMADIELDQALGLARGATTAEPHRSDYLDTLAMVHWRRGELREARAASEKAARLSPGDVYLLWQLDRMREAAPTSSSGRR